MATIKNMLWSIKRAVIDVESIEDSEVQELLSNWVNSPQEAQVGELPEIEFEFDADNMDEDPSDYFERSIYSFGVTPGENNHSVVVGKTEDGEWVISISVVFPVELVDGVDVDALNDFLAENGGWSAGNADGGWSYSSDDGGDCMIME